MSSTTDRALSRRRTLAAIGAIGGVGLAGCSDNSGNNSGNNSDDNSGDNSACELSLETEVQGEFRYDQQGTYLFEICNTGDEDCSDPITIEDDLPDGISFGSISGEWTASASDGVVEATNDTYGSLPPGDCLTVEMVVEVATPSEVSGRVENCANLFYDDDRHDEDCLSHDVASSECELSLEKSTRGGFRYGQRASYTYEVCNESDEGSNERCTGPLTINDFLRDGLTFESVSGEWTANVSDSGVVQVTNDSYGSLTPGECLTLQITLTVSEIDEFPDDFSGRMESCADLFHDGEFIAEGCVTHDITQPTDEECELSFEKNTQDEFSYGEQATYGFEVCNEGDQECTRPLTIEDELPNGINFEELGDGLSGSVSDDEVVEAEIIYDSLTPGECLLRTMTVRVEDADDFEGGSNFVTNCAELSQGDESVIEDCVTIQR